MVARTNGRLSYPKLHARVVLYSRLQNFGTPPPTSLHFCVFDARKDAAHQARSGAYTCAQQGPYTSATHPPRTELKWQQQLMRRTFKRRHTCPMHSGISFCVHARGRCSE